MNRVRRITLIAMMISLSLLLHMVESAIPLPVVIPGFKLGLANIVGLFCWEVFDFKTMVKVNLARILFASLLNGQIFAVSFYLSLAGCLCSMTMMYLAKRFSKMSLYGISICGSVFHNVGQVIVVTSLYQQFFMQLFLPTLILLAIPTGWCMAFVTIKVLDRFKGDVNYGEVRI